MNVRIPAECEPRESQLERRVSALEALVDRLASHVLNQEVSNGAANHFSDHAVRAGLHRASDGTDEVLYGGRKDRVL